MNKAIKKNKEAISEQGEMITELDNQLSTTNSKLGTLSRDFDAAKKDIETNKENIEKEKSLRETADDMLYGDITDNREAINKESEKREALEKALETETLRSIDADVEHEFAMKEAAKEREYLGEVLDKTVSKVGKLELDKADKTDVEKVKSDLSAAKEDMENKLGTAYDQIDENNTVIKENKKEIERLDEEKASKKFVDSGLNAAREALKAEEAEIAEVKNRQQEEIAERVKGDLANSNAIKAETKAREAKDTELAGKIAEERKDRQDADTELNDGIKANKKLIEKEVKNREAAVKTVKEMADNAQKSADKANAAIENKETGLAAAHTKAEVARVEADEANAAVAEETTARKEADRIHDAAIESNRSAISHLDKKVNKGTAMLVAMSNVDFQDVNAGEVAVGAGVGHYVGDQAVAVGVAYGVNDDFKVHAKFSGVAGDPHYNAIGGGLTYKFRTR